MLVTYWDTSHLMFYTFPKSPFLSQKAAKISILILIEVNRNTPKSQGIIYK